MLPATPTRQQIEALAARLLVLEKSTGVVNLDEVHHHADGVYGRSIVIRAGTVLVGLAHKRSGLAVSIGDLTIWTEKGRQRFTGAHVLNSQPGMLRVGFAHKDTTFMTVHANDTGSVDPQVIEDALVEHPGRLMTRRAP